MDAQNAVESSHTKQAASPRRRDTEPDDPKPPTTTTLNNIKSPLNPKLAFLTKDSRSASTLSNAQDDDVGPDQNSDAETIVLPGKDGVSPSKPRKVIKHEDKSDGEIDDILPPPRKSLKDGKDGERNGAPSDDTSAASLLGKKKRLLEREKQQRSNSVGVSSAPASPPAYHRHGNDPSHRRRTSGDPHSESGSESSKPRAQKQPLKDKAKSVDRQLPSKRKAPKAESEDEGESRKARRPRISDAGLDSPASARDRDHKASSGRYSDKQSTARNRSPSPHNRIHRRRTKKRRVPAPLQSTDYPSDDSSASGSPHPRSSKLRSIATPVTGESTISPARMAPHKKHVDNHGQTLLAKACAKGEYEMAKKRLSERPEDLNFADYAGNTPLQIASLNGHEDIVQLLIDAGCNLDCRNSDKETPLLDAVENGHLGVIKILLKAGVNPRKADAEGHEPLEKVPDDLDNADEIRAALREAKERVGELRRTSEDHHPQDLHDALSSHGPESPRRSPAASASSTLAAQRRGGTTLRQAAARGDNETVTQALVNAARGGHSFVVELLLALGGANPDPRPVPNLPNIEVIKLLLNASGRREGPMWKEEEHILKNAYDEFKRSSKGSKAKSSPARRDRDTEQESRRVTRRESSPDGGRSHKRRPSSPSRDVDSKRRLGSTKVSGSPREKRRSLSFGNHEEQTSPKRGPGRPKREERHPSTDREISEPELPRRKLISGKDLKGQREKQRRASMASNNSATDQKSRPDRLSENLSGGDNPGKRHRSSDDSDAPIKRRKLDAEGREKRPLSTSSPDDQLERKDSLKAKKSNAADKNKMRDAPTTISAEDCDIRAEQAEAEAAAAAAEEAKKKEAERQRQEEERRQAEAKRREQEAEKKRQEQEEQEEEKARLEEEQKQKEERERKQREEEQKQKEEEERKKREEEERIRREKEAAEEAARRLREEEERRERERKRVAREAELQRARQEEQERIRLSKLPPLLRWLDGCPDPKRREIAELFSKAQGVRYDTIRPQATGRPDGREQWLLNTQVALLLGEKDLSLSRYSSWERISVSHVAKRVIWRLEQDRYALTEGKLYHLGEQLSDYYGGNPHTVGYRRLEQLRGEAAKCFFETEMFFVKESDFLYLVPSIPHLRDVKLSICYCELPEHESALSTWSSPAKWKQDPDAESRGSFAPRYKHYTNGELVSEDKPRQYKPSKEPFPEHRVPRRGLVAVTPDEPDYARLCLEQNLGHLLTEQQKQSVLNGAHLTPRSLASNEAIEYGRSRSPTSVSPHTITHVNGIKRAQESPERLPNGTNGNHLS
ncbi:hypothetical protein F4809DRAFT_665077 [Biscogniauxia mediterranea]|nr:hypothetical protein F4809DRAFT_665077 [Biscogniauxia mediterranea]